MNTDSIWLSTSLFTFKKNWNQLLASGVKPFLAEGNINEFLVEFNYSGGDNIRLSLLVSEADAPSVTERVDFHFKRYFAATAITEDTIGLNSENIFMPFPVNTIQYGLYPPEKITSGPINQNTLQVKLSSVLLDVLKDDIIDDETILTFAFYLQIGVVKSIYNYIKDIDELFLIIAQFKANSSKGNIKGSMANSILMEEITFDVMKNIYLENDLYWLNSWFNFNNDILQSRTINRGDFVRLRDFYITTIEAIYKRLGINNYLKELLSGLVNDSVRKYFLNI